MYILKCEAFDFEPTFRHVNKCCEGDCHGTGSLIQVTPYAIDASLENRRIDWELGIQAAVCCGRYHFVRSLSREWWVNKGQAIGLWDRARAEALMHRGSWHRSFDSDRRDEHTLARTSGVSVATIKKVATGKGKCPACGTKWSGEVCDNCGHGAGI